MLFEYLSLDPNPLQKKYNQQSTGILNWMRLKTPKGDLQRLPKLNLTPDDLLSFLWKAEDLVLVKPKDASKIVVKSHSFWVR